MRVWQGARGRGQVCVWQGGPDLEAGSLRAHLGLIPSVLVLAHTASHLHAQGFHTVIQVDIFTHIETSHSHTWTLSHTLGMLTLTPKQITLKRYAHTLGHHHTHSCFAVTRLGIFPLIRYDTDLNTTMCRCSCVSHSYTWAFYTTLKHDHT